MRAIKIFLGIIIGLIAGILGFIALGSVLSTFSIPKPAEIYRHAPEKSLIGYFLIFYPIAFMFFGSILDDIFNELSCFRHTFFRVIFWSFCFIDVLFFIHFTLLVNPN